MSRTSKPIVALFGTLFAATAPLIAQLPTVEDLNRGLQVEVDQINDVFTLSWWGRAGDSYFMQVTPDLNEDWNYVEQIRRGGNGVIQHVFATNAEALFFRVRHSGVPVPNPDLADFDKDGLNNLTELRLGLDPFNDGDAVWGEVAGLVQAAWNEVDIAWRQRFVSGPSAAFYDPDGTISTVADVRPLDDYDGDGVVNVLEYLDGTDPVDFFNGAAAKIRALGGDAQTAPPITFMADDLRVSVTDESGAEWDRAPIRFSVSGGFDGLWTDANTGFVAETTVRNTLSGAEIAFETPASIGTSTVTASLPNGESLTFTLYTVDPTAKARQGVTNFKKTLNDDGTATYTWNAGPAEGDFFKLQTRRPDGTWQAFYETSYGSPDLPLAVGQTEFSLTVPVP